MINNKIILIFIITGSLLCAGIAKANSNHNDSLTDFRDRLLFGIKAGANNSNVYDSKGETFNTKSKYGFAGGIFIAIPIGRYLAIQPELLYSQKGFEGTGSILANSYRLTRTTSFLDVPLLLVLKPSEFISLVGGPQYSYLLMEKDVFTSGIINVEQEKAFENTNLRKNILCLTTGIDFTLKHIVVSGRVGWDVQHNNGDGTSSIPRYKNAWYQATLGYRFL